MGRIKTKLVKRAAKELLKRHGSEFKTIFDDNKPVIARFAEVRSKKLRNVLAGYLTHLKRTKDEF
jgi:small subunit ribosomal protein S17e